MKALAVFTIFIMTFAMLGCPPPPPEKETTYKITPYDLKVDADKGKFDISWKIKGTGLKSGFNIYISETPLAEKYPTGTLPASVKPYNPTIFPGDTDPSDGVEHFPAELLSDTVKYYVSVRVVYPDHTLSAPSNEVTAVASARGEIELAIRYEGEHDGYDFAGDKFVAADDLANDIYFYSKDGDDVLASPARLGFGLKDNRLALLSVSGDNLEKIKKTAAAFAPNSDKERVTVKKGDWVVIKQSDNSYTLVNVLGFEGQGKDRKIKLYFVHSPFAEPLFL